MSERLSLGEPAQHGARRPNKTCRAQGQDQPSNATRHKSRTQNTLISILLQTTSDSLHTPSTIYSTLYNVSNHVSKRPRLLSCLTSRLARNLVRPRRYRPSVTPRSDCQSERQAGLANYKLSDVRDSLPPGAESLYSKAVLHESNTT